MKLSDTQFAIYLMTSFISYCWSQTFIFTFNPVQAPVLSELISCMTSAAWKKFHQHIFMTLPNLTEFSWQHIALRWGGWKYTETMALNSIQEMNVYLHMFLFSCHTEALHRKYSSHKEFLHISLFSCHREAAYGKYSSCKKSRIVSAYDF
jgi:hypothetical protein